MNYYVTGNEYVSLPTIRESDGAIEGLSFLHMGAKGMIELCGSGEKPPFETISAGQSEGNAACESEMASDASLDSGFFRNCGRDGA